MGTLHARLHGLDGFLREFVERYAPLLPRCAELFSRSAALQSDREVDHRARAVDAFWRNQLITAITDPPEEPHTVAVSLDLVERYARAVDAMGLLSTQRHLYWDARCVEATCEHIEGLIASLRRRASLRKSN